MTLFDFWPASDRIRERLTALQNGDPKLVAAVHQPMRLRRVNPVEPLSEPISEQEFLASIMNEAGLKIITLSGQAGTGKSHLRHWLEAKWNHQIDVQRRTLLTFESSDSRATVRQKLAETFPDSRVLRAGKKPATAFDPKGTDAPRLLRDQFVVALEKTEAEAKQRLGEAKQRGTSPSALDRDVGTWLAKGLRDYLSDPVTGKPFLVAKTGVFSNLVEMIAAGKGDILKQDVFRAEHFARQDGVDILRASNPAQLFYKKLNLTSDQFRVASAKLMNELASEVLAEPSPTSEISVTTLLEQLQEELQATGRKLLIAIEKSSIEGDLTALVANGQCWEIEPRIFADRSEMTDAIVELVGAYLNAIRTEKLDLDPEDQSRAEAFGQSKLGHLLFPFNLTAIRQISETNELLEFHPGQIIELFFEKVLDPYRETFLDGQFPPANFLDFDSSRVGIEIHKALEQQYPDRSGQYLPLLAYWGECPSSLDRIHLSDRVYRAFGLEPLIFAPIQPVAPAESEPIAPPFIHAEVQAFFNAVHSGGASFALLTKEVLRWLAETQQIQNFSIVGNRPEDEISCGLS